MTCTKSWIWNGGWSVDRMGATIISLAFHDSALKIRSESPKFISFRWPPYHSVSSLQSMTVITSMICRPGRGSKTWQHLKCSWNPWASNDALHVSIRVRKQIPYLVIISLALLGRRWLDTQWGETIGNRFGVLFSIGGCSIVKLDLEEKSFCLLPMVLFGGSPKKVMNSCGQSNRNSPEVYFPDANIPF